MNEDNFPPGFRFQPTDEELITYYLDHKVSDFNFTSRAITDVDLNKSEPWDLPAKASMGEKEWYFFSLRDRKYPTGMRTNRATKAGYWKTIGKDKEIDTTNKASLTEEEEDASVEDLDQTRQQQPQHSTGKSNMETSREVEDDRTDHEEMEEQDLASKVDLEEDELEELRTLNKLRRSRRQPREPTCLQNYARGKKGKRVIY